jgi:hypothetical protein
MCGKGKLGKRVQKHNALVEMAMHKHNDEYHYHHHYQPMKVNSVYLPDIWKKGSSRYPSYPQTCVA